MSTVREDKPIREGERVAVFFTDREGGSWQTVEAHSILLPTGERWDALSRKVLPTEEGYYEKILELRTGTCSQCSGTGGIVTRRKGYGDGVFVSYAQCPKCGGSGNLFHPPQSLVLSPDFQTGEKF